MRTTTRIAARHHRGTLTLTRNAVTTYPDSLTQPLSQRRIVVVRYYSGRKDWLVRVVNPRNGEIVSRHFWPTRASAMQSAYSWVGLNYEG